MDPNESIVKVPESEDSDPGYVQLVVQSVATLIANKSQLKVAEVPAIADGSTSKMEIILAKDQLQLRRNSPEPAVLSNILPLPSASRNEFARKVTVHSPIKPKLSFSHNKDWSLKINCQFCDKPYVDPRLLSCLHSFCLGCLTKLTTEGVNEASSKPLIDLATDMDCPTFCASSSTVNEKSSTSGTNSSSQSGDVALQQAQPSTANSTTTRRASQKSLSSITTASKSRSFLIEQQTVVNIICSLCGSTTVNPSGGLSRLPQNTILSKLVDKYSMLPGIRRVTCGVCSDLESTATFACAECAISLCQSCSELHMKQKTTRSHRLVRAADKDSRAIEKPPKKCTIHPNNDCKLFCTNCNQVACAECAATIHNGHKCESIHKAIKVYSKLLSDNISRVRPTGDYATLTISKLVAISKKVDKKCEVVRQQVEAHLNDYQTALDHHRNTLFHQVQKAREMKITSIESQKTDLETRSAEAKTAIEFAEMVLENGSESEVMSIVGVILKRFEYCEKSKVPLDANVNDSLRFLPEIRAPSSSVQNNIPLFGIITTQTADPDRFSIEGKGLSNLKVNKRVDILVIARDRENKQLCHGGLKLQVELRYGDLAGRVLEHQITDKRDGTYQISFIPDATGTIRLSVCVAGKPIMVILVQSVPWKH